MNRSSIIKWAMVATIIALLLVLILVLASPFHRIGNVGRIKTVNVWCDTDFIDWGFVEPNNTYSYIVRINNTSNIPVILNITTENMQPPNMTDYLTVDWDYDNATLQVGNSITTNILLSTADNLQESNVTRFEFDIIIIGRG